MSLFCFALLCVHSSFAIILKRKRKLCALLLLSYRCITTLNVMWLFLKVSWAGLQCVIVVFPDHTHLLLGVKCQGQTYFESVLGLLTRAPLYFLTICASYTVNSNSIKMHICDVKIRDLGMIYLYQ